MYQVLLMYHFLLAPKILKEFSSISDNAFSAERA